MVVRVRATSLNFATYLQILGKYQEKPRIPFVPGSDCSGVVEQVGPGVEGLTVGDRACGLAAQGSFAEIHVTDESEWFEFVLRLRLRLRLIEGN